MDYYYQNSSINMIYKVFQDIKLFINTCDYSPLDYYRLLEIFWIPLSYFYWNFVTIMTAANSIIIGLLLYWQMFEFLLFIYGKIYCSVYSQSKKSFSKLSDLRWWFFSQKQSSSDNMPPTLAALKPAILRCHYQCLEWYRDILAHPCLPPAEEYGWKLINAEFEPIICDPPCAPDEVLNLVRCSCSKNNCSQRCKCATSNVVCTEMCACGGNRDFCATIGVLKETNLDSEDSSDEDTVG